MVVVGLTVTILVVPLGFAPMLAVQVYGAVPPFAVSCTAVPVRIQPVTEGVMVIGVGSAKFIVPVLIVFGVLSESVTATL